jgi:hypothetical protein
VGVPQAHLVLPATSRQVADDFVHRRGRLRLRRRAVNTSIRGYDDAIARVSGIFHLGDINR